MAIHEKAKHGYQRGSREYEQGRPDYPSEVAEFIRQHLPIKPSTHVVEVGAGTGKFTSLLATLDCAITAIEPVPKMREAFHSLLPWIPVLDGTSDHLPISAKKAHAVMVAQAFHWFNGVETIHEFARILKPGGLLMLVWNIRDETVDWAAQFTQLLESYRGDTPSYQSGQWKKAFQETELFTPLEYISFPHSQTVTPDILVNRALSTSFIAAMPEDERKKVEAEVRHLVKTHPAFSQRTTIELPYHTHVYWCHLRDPQSA